MITTPRGGGKTAHRLQIVKNQEPKGRKRERKMKKIAIEKLWGLVNRIDTIKKANIAEDFIRQCELSNEDFDELMMAVAAQHRFLYELEVDARKKPQYQRYAH